INSIVIPNSLLLDSARIPLLTTICPRHFLQIQDKVKFKVTRTVLLPYKGFIGGKDSDSGFNDDGGDVGTGKGKQPTCPRRGEKAFSTGCGGSSGDATSAHQPQT